MGETDQPRPVLIALGSNLGNREANLSQACDRISQQQGVDGFVASRWLDTSPVGGPSQERFLNGAAFFRTQLSLPELFSLLKETERQVGRAKTERWGPREIDLDLLLYGEEIVTGDPTVPHPRMAFRNFVLAPAVEVAPDMRHPLIGWTIRELLDHLQTCPPAFAFAMRDEQRMRRLTSLVSEKNVAKLTPKVSFCDFVLPKALIWQTLWAEDSEVPSSGTVARPKLVITDSFVEKVSLGPLIDVSQMTDNEAVVEIVAAIEAMRQ